MLWLEFSYFGADLRILYLQFGNVHSTNQVSSTLIIAEAYHCVRLRWHLLCDNSNRRRVARTPCATRYCSNTVRTVPVYLSGKAEDHVSLLGLHEESSFELPVVSFDDIRPTECHGRMLHNDVRLLSALTAPTWVLPKQTLFQLYCILNCHSETVAFLTVSVNHDLLS